jgi:hypothetical protein
MEALAGGPDCQTGETTYTEPSSYRPMSLTSRVCKLLEIIVLQVRVPFSPSPPVSTYVELLNSHKRRGGREGEEAEGRRRVKTEGSLGLERIKIKSVFN